HLARPRRQCPRARREGVMVSGADDARLMLSRLSSDKVREATGRGWEEWFEVLDAAGAPDLDHKGIVTHLEQHHSETDSWWRQSIAVGYEQARGMRKLGETASGFQVSVQRSVAGDAGAAWRLIEARPESLFGGAVELTEGTRYEVPAVGDAMAASGEVRVVKPGDRIRMTWQPVGWVVPATVQVTLLESVSGKTAINVLLEKLADAEQREIAQAHWRSVLERIIAADSSK
ncbi:MAG TPA: SRPBCC domain-containing protein, partial [Acidimicrobiia bacterium]|nr:SRPBCC domain-containing protein [Acidimicrobiia bacterium]